MRVRVSLTREDIDDKIIYIKKSVCQKVKGDYQITPPKDKSSVRDITMPDKLYSVLKKHKEFQKKYSDNFSKSYYICGGVSPVPDTVIENHNKAYSDGAGLPHIKVHDFRHSHASLLCNAGINIQEIARRLGHSNTSMTLNTYLHLYPSEKDRAVEVLNQIQNSK